MPSQVLTKDTPVTKPSASSRPPAESARGWFHVLPDPPAGPERPLLVAVSKFTLIETGFCTAIKTVAVSEGRPPLSVTSNVNESGPP